jgi:hypothetical protein
VGEDGVGDVGVGGIEAQSVDGELKGAKDGVWCQIGNRNTGGRGWGSVVQEAKCARMALEMSASEASMNS